MGKYDIGGNISKSNKDSLMFLHDFDDTLDDLKEKSKVKYRYDLDLKDRAKADELYSKFQEQSKNGINNYFTTIPTALRKATQAYKEYNEQEDKSSENSKQLINETVRWGNAYLALGGEIDETSKKMFDFVKVQTEVLNKKTGGGYNYTKEKFEDIFSTIKELMDYVDDFRIFSSNFTVKPKLDISSIKEKAEEAQNYLDNIYENDYYRNGGIFSENEEKNLLKYLGFLSQYYTKIKHLSEEEMPESFTYADKGGYNLYKDRNNNNALVYGESIRTGMKEFSTMFSSIRNAAVKKVKDEQIKLFDEIKQGYKQSTDFINDLIDEINSKLDESAKKIQFISQEQVNIIRSSRSFEELRPVYDETGKQEGSYIDKDSFTSASQKYDELFDKIRDGAITSDEAIEEMSRHFFEAFKQGNAIGHMTDDVKEFKKEIDSLLSQLNALKDELAEAKADASSWENVASSELDQRINYEVQNEKLLKRIDDQQQQIDNLERQIKLQNTEYDLGNDSDYTGYGNGYGYGSYDSSDISNNLLSDIDGYLSKIHNIINSFNFDIFNGFPSFTNSVTSYLDLIYSMTVDIYNLFKNCDGKINITNISNLSGNFDTNSPLQKKYKELSGYLDLIFNPVKSRSKFNASINEDEIIKQSTFTTIDKVSGRTIAVNFSPILVDENGKQIGVMSAKELKKYAQDVLNNVRPDDLKLRGNIFQGENAEVEAKKAAENLFNSQLRLQSRKSQSFQYSVNFEEIASAIVQNIPSVSNKFGGDINKFLSQYDPSIIQGLPNVAERVDRITDLLGWIKQLSKGKNIFDPEIAKVIKSAGKNIPSIDELTKENENSNTTFDDILNQMLSQLKEITHQISLVVDSLTLSSSNDVPNLQDEYLNTRNRNLKQLYSDIETDSKGNISTKKSNVPKIQAFVDQFYKYGEGQWDLKEFGRLNNISAKSLNVLKEYYDELKNANISVEDSIEKVNDSLIEQKDILSSPVSDSSSELKQEEQAALDTSDSIDKLNQSKIENAKVNNAMNDSCLETSAGLDKESTEAKETANEIEKLNEIERENDKNGLSSGGTTQTQTEELKNQVGFLNEEQKLYENIFQLVEKIVSLNVPGGIMADGDDFFKQQEAVSRLTDLLLYKNNGDISSKSQLQKYINSQIFFSNNPIETIVDNIINGYNNIKEYTQKIRDLFNNLGIEDTSPYQEIIDNWNNGEYASDFNKVLSDIKQLYDSINISLNIDDVGFSYEQLRHKILSENEEIKKGNELFKERISYIDEINNKVTDSYIGSYDAVLPGSHSENSRRILHTHSDEIITGGMFSSNDIQGFINEYLSNRIDGFDLQWKNSLLSVDLSGITENDAQVISSLYGTIQDALYKIFGELNANGTKLTIPTDIADDFIELSNSIFAQMIEYAGGKITKSSILNDGTLSNIQKLKLPTDLQLKPILQFLSGFNKLPDTSNLDAIDKLLDKIDFSQVGLKIREDLSSKVSRAVEYALGSAPENMISDLNNGLSDLFNSEELDRVKSIFNDWNEDKTYPKTDVLVSRLVELYNEIHPISQNILTEFKNLFQSNKSDISSADTFNNDQQNKLQEDLKESQDQAEKTAESLKEVADAQSKLNEEKKESVELSREENNVVNNIPEMINEDAVSEEKSLSQVTEETSNSLKTEGDIAEATSQKLDKLSEAKRRLIEYEEKLSGATKETSDKLKEEGSSAKEASKNVGKANSVNKASGSSKSKEKTIDYLKQVNKLYDDIQKKGNKYADLNYISEHSIPKKAEKVEKAAQSKKEYEEAKDAINKFYAEITDLFKQNKISKDDYNKIAGIVKSGNAYSPTVSSVVKGRMTDSFQGEMNKMLEKLDLYISPDIDEEKFNVFKKRVEDLKQKIEGIDWVNIPDKDINEIKELYSKIKSEYDDKKYKPFYTQGNPNRIKDLLVNATSLESNSYIPERIKNSLRVLIDELKQLDSTGKYSAATVDNIGRSIRDLEIESNRAGKSFVGQIANRLKDMNAKFIATYFSIMDIVRYARTVISTITELDTAFTEMRKVSDESIKSLKEYQKTTFDTASAIGTTAIELQNSTADWMRLGETIEEAAESSKEATILMNVSEFNSIDEATQSLVAMSQAYKDLSKQEIVDVLNKIGNEFPIATDELSIALQSSASTLMTQGNDLYEAVALITAGNQVIQDANKVGTGIRTISLRIAGTEESKAELEELGEEVEDYVVMTEAKKRQIIKDYTAVASNNGEGVDIIDPNGNLKNTYQILLEISKVYKEIQEEDKKYGTNRAQGLVEELAGKNRSNIAASILMNPDTLESVYNASQNAEGSAQEELDKYLDSINGKVQQFKNELQSIENNIISSDFLKNIIDLGTSLLSVINNIIGSSSMIPSIFAGIAAGIGLTANSINILTGNAKTFSGIFDNIKHSFSDFKVTFSPKNLQFFGKTYLFNKTTRKEIKQFESEMSYYSEQLGEDLVFVGDEAENSFNKISSSLNVTFSPKTKELIKGGVQSLKQYDSAQKAAAVSSKALAVGVTALKAVINSLISIGISILITSVIKGVDYLIHYSEKLEEAANEARNSIKELNEELENNEKLVNESGKRYAELAQNVKDLGKATQSQGTLSNDEYAEFLDISNQLAEAFPGLQNGFTGERDAILNLNGGVKTITESLENLLDIEQQLSEQKYIENIEDIYKDDINKYTKERDNNDDILDNFKSAKSDYEALINADYDYLNKLGPTSDAWNMLASAGLDLNTVLTSYDLENVVKENKDIIDYIYNETINEYEKQLNFSEDKLNKINKEFSEYAYMYIKQTSGYMSLDEDKQMIVRDIISNFDFSELPDEVYSWDSLSNWLNNNLLYSISKIDNQKIQDKMIDVLSGSITPSDIEQAYKDILAYLNSIGFDDDVIVYWKLKYDEASSNLDNAAKHIEDSLITNKNIPISVQDDERFGRARSWVSQLTNDELNKLMEIDVSNTTITSLEQLRKLIQRTNKDIYEGNFIDQFNHLLNDDKYKYVKEHLMDLSTEGKLDADTLKSYRGFNDILRDLGITLGEDDEKLQKALDLINDIAKSDGINALDKYSTDLSSLSDAYSNFSNSELITPSQLKALKDSFGEFDSYKNFEEAVLSGDSNLQEHFNNLAAEILYEDLALKGLNESNKDYYVQSLKTMGITNAQEVVEQALVNTQRERETVLKEISAVNSEYNKTGNDVISTTEQLENATSEELIKLALEAEQSGISASALAGYALQKAIVEGTIFNESTEIDSLIKVAQMAGIAGGALGEYIEIKKKLDWFESSEAKGYMPSDAYNAQKKYWENKAEGLYDDITDQIDKTLNKTEYSGLNIDFSAPLDDASGSAETFKEILDKILAMYDAELDAGVTSFKEYVNKSRSIIEQYYRDGKISAQEYYDSLSDLSNKQIAEYDKVINAVTRKINEQIDALNDQKESIEESYNLQIEEIQNKIDALQDENDEIDKNMALQKAQFDLAKAMNQRTKLMYSESRGFYYEADLSAVSDAREEVRKAQLDKTVYDLEKQIKVLEESMKNETDAIDEQIKKLQDYADEWSNVSSKLNNAIEDQRAAEILGANWEADILAERLDVLKNFTDQYVSLQQQQKDAYLKAREAEVNGGAGGTNGGTNGSTNGSNNNNSSEANVSDIDIATIPKKTTTVYTYPASSREFTTSQQASQSASQEKAKALNDLRKNPSYVNAPQQYKDKMLADLDKKYQVTSKIKAYASGTEGAERGDAIVGEFDPEIVLNNDGTASIIDEPTLLNLKGGETIFNGEQTKKILKGYTSLEDKDPKRFKMLNAFANGTNTSFQNAFANKGLSLAGVGTGLMYNTNNVGQTVNNVFNVSLPNIHDGSKAADLFKEFEHLSMKATQFFNK